MPFLRDDNIGTAQYGLQDFAPTSSQALGATVDETLEGNPTNVLWDLNSLRRKNNTDAERLTAYDAEEVIKESGVRGLKVQDGQYNKEALDTLIERKRQETIRQDTLSRTEYSWGGTPVRGLAMLGASIIDPLNIASAFVPVVGEARVATMLGRTAAGSFDRALVRATVGATEGVVGAALIEPINLYGRSQLQDDYDMSDSLVNMAFGGVLGGGLHVAGGQLADRFRSTDPYSRFATLTPEQTRSVLDFEGSKSLTPAQTEVMTADWTPKMREAAGLVVREEPTLEPAKLYQEAVDVPRGISKEDFNALYQSYPQEVIDSIASRIGQPDLPFTRLSESTPEGATASASRQLAEDMRAELLADAGNRAAPGDVAKLKSDLTLLQQSVKENEARFKLLAKEYQGTGLSRKQAESRARKDIDTVSSDLSARQDAINNQLESNAKASQAEQDIAALTRGEVPARFKEQVQSLADGIRTRADIARSLQPPTARSIVESATPTDRQAAFRAAIAQAVQGRDPDVAALLRPETATLNQVKTVAERQADANSLAVGDPAAASAATQRLRDAPKDEGLIEAENALTQASDRLKQLKDNLEQGGMDKEKTAKYLNELKKYDEVLANADAYGKAARAAALCGLRT